MTADDEKDRDDAALPDAGKRGVSSEEPAEGADDVVPPGEGSPKG